MSITPYEQLSDDDKRVFLTQRLASNERDHFAASIFRAEEVAADEDTNRSDATIAMLEAKITADRAALGAL